MISASVTISLVPEAKGGPFVYWDNLESSCASAAQLGFTAVEVFLPSGTACPQLREILPQHHLRLAALGTGAGWLLQGLSLTHADKTIRARALEFIRGMIDLGGSLGAPAIVGSMQGRFDQAVPKPQALEWLAESLGRLGEHAARFDVPLLYEPLNRYETNLINQVADGLKLLQATGNQNIKLLADCYHMNIEEASLQGAFRAGGNKIGHVHFVDSNRRAAGYGHIDFQAISQALCEIGYQGYLSAEAVPYPNSEEAARQTMSTFRRWFVV